MSNECNWNTCFLLTLSKKTTHCLQWAIVNSWLSFSASNVSVAEMSNYHLSWVWKYTRKNRVTILFYLFFFLKTESLCNDIRCCQIPTAANFYSNACDVEISFLYWIDLNFFSYNNYLNSYLIHVTPLTIK